MTENYYVVITEEVKGGNKKSRNLIARAKDYGKTLYKYHQTIRGVEGYEDSNVGDKHTLVKQGNVIGVKEVKEEGEEIDLEPQEIDGVLKKQV
jgi:hypothetical protein